MPKFIITFERSCVIEETGAVEIGAASKTDARRIAKAMIGDGGEGVDWQPSDTNYGTARIEGIVERARTEPSR